MGLVRRRGFAGLFDEVLWDGRERGEWANSLEGADALVNLAGRSVNCRYHRRNRQAILESRTSTTRVLGEAVGACSKPPGVWINSSTATIYRHAEDRPQSESSGELGDGFSAEVARSWEEAFFGTPVPGRVRQVALRTALVFGRERATVLSYLLRLAQFRLGGRMGSGRQRVSWIHEEDFCRAVEWIIDQPEFDGAVNLSSPQSVTNSDLMAAVRRAAGVRLGLPASRLMLEAGTFLLRTESELVLKSRWVIPERLVQGGFAFHWGDLDHALSNLTGSCREEP